jgi:AraC-like DNA-binding protein
MIYFLQYDMPTACKHLLREQLDGAGINCSVLNANELEVSNGIADQSLDLLNSHLIKMGIQVVSSGKAVLVQKIKMAILELINQEEKLISSTTSQYLANTLNHSYRYLSAIFAESTFTTIENYMILLKIERAKSMINVSLLTFSEIAWKLNYSSVGHFSLQFKNTTGFTPSKYKKLVQLRRERLTNARKKQVLQLNPVLLHES